MVLTSNVEVQTKGNCDIVDITRHVAQGVTESGFNAGTAVVFVAHSTAGIAAMECEPGLIKDFKALFERLAPAGIEYKHDLGSGEGNGHAHVRASLLGPSLSVPFSAGRLLLGTWQQIVLIDFDNRPRTRQVLVQITGE